MSTDFFREHAIMKMSEEAATLKLPATNHKSLTQFWGTCFRLKCAEGMWHCVFGCFDNKFND